MVKDFNYLSDWWIDQKTLANWTSEYHRKRCHLYFWFRNATIFNLLKWNRYHSSKQSPTSLLSCPHVCRCPQHFMAFSTGLVVITSNVAAFGLFLSNYPTRASYGTLRPLMKILPEIVPELSLPSLCLSLCIFDFLFFPSSSFPSFIRLSLSFCLSLSLSCF